MKYEKLFTPVKIGRLSFVEHEKVVYLIIFFKVLLEIFGKEAMSDFDKMTDDELIKLKEKLLKELNDEN